jgi:SAM-dependent methyltransferase
MTTEWGGGYVTDVEYTAHYFPSQSPAMMALACLINGIAVDPPWDAPGQHYLELGCGRGMNACVIAAANPDWRVTGIDFMPGAIAEARSLAAEGGLGNITFIEADLSGFAGSAAADALPMADIVTAHGVWSWVSDAVRAGIVRLLAGKLRAGGMFHVSYNALPGQQAMLAAQRVMRESGRRLAGRSDRQVTAGRDMVKALAGAGALHLTSTQVVRELLGQIDELPVPYLAHEYMNEHWNPCYHADVAADLAAARLDYAGSARLVDNFVELLLTPEQRALHDRFDDPAMRQLVIDTCINRTLRHDVFVRGTRTLSVVERDAEIGRMHVGLAVAQEDFRYVLQMPAGEATVGDSYRALVAALGEGPRSLGDLARLNEAQGRKANLGELATVLVGTNQAVALRAPAAGPAAGVDRFNAALARRAAGLGNLNATAVLASQRIGAGVPSRAAEVLVAGEIGVSGGVPDPAAFAAALLPAAPEADRRELAGIIARVLRDRLAIWRSLGVV